MLLILARHGNTFEPSDTPVWVGAQEDLPLAAKGLDQSRAIGESLRTLGHIPDRIIAGPLKRTRIGAELAGEVCGFSGDIEIDERLKEIDYGIWGGQSDSQIAERWGRDAITNWREKSIPPSGAGWTPSPEVLRANARAAFDAFTRDRSDDVVVLVITSNGILRYFHRLLAGDQAQVEEAKVKTGHICAAQISLDGLRLRVWNTAPEAFVEAMSS